MTVVTQMGDEVQITRVIFWGSMDLSAFIDEVYEAAVVPELWPKVLDSLTVIGDGFGALMFTADGEHQRSIESRTAVPFMVIILPKAGTCGMTVRPDYLRQARRVS